MPSSGTLRTIDPVVQRFSLGYKNEATGFVAGRILPTFPTRGKQTGSYYEMARANLFSAPRMAHRADGAESHEVRWTFAPATFRCEPRAYNTFNTPRQKANVEGPLDLDREDSEFLTELLMLEKEIDVFNAVDALTIVAGAPADLTEINGVTLAGAFQWNDTGAPTPRPRFDVHQRMVQIKKQIGRWPNLMVMGGGIWDSIMETTDNAALAGGLIMSMITSVRPGFNGDITPALVAQYFGLRGQLIVADAIQNTAGLTAAGTVTNDYIWDDQILLAYVSPRPTIKQPTFGWTFTESGLRGYSWTKAERRNAKFNEVEEVIDEAFVATVAAAIISDVLE